MGYPRTSLKSRKERDHNIVEANVQSDPVLFLPKQQRQYKCSADKVPVTSNDQIPLEALPARQFY